MLCVRLENVAVDIAAQTPHSLESGIEFQEVYTYEQIDKLSKNLKFNVKLMESSAERTHAIYKFFKLF